MQNERIFKDGHWLFDQASMIGKAYIMSLAVIFYTIGQAVSVE